MGAVSDYIVGDFDAEREFRVVSRARNAVVREAAKGGPWYMTKFVGSSHELRARMALIGLGDTAPEGGEQPAAGTYSQSRRQRVARRRKAKRLAVARARRAGGPARLRRPSRSPHIPHRRTPNQKTFKIKNYS